MKAWLIIIIFIIFIFAYLSFAKFRRKNIRKKWAKDELEDWKNPLKGRDPVEEYKRKMRTYLAPQKEAEHRRIKRMLTLRSIKKRGERIVVLGEERSERKEKKDKPGGLFNMFD